MDAECATLLTHILCLSTDVHQDHILDNMNITSATTELRLSDDSDGHGHVDFIRNI